MSQPVRTFGRIPPETAALLQQTVANVRGNVLNLLPPTMSPESRASALDIVLGVVLRDWRENGNTTGLIDSDIADLRSFVQFALQVAATGQPAESEPVFLSVLRGLMEDWLANWNAPNDPGPPGPID
jgi:hypothetical protein